MSNGKIICKKIDGLTKENVEELFAQLIGLVEIDALDEVKKAISKLSRYVVPEMFSATGATDGTDTQAIQDFFDYITTNQTTGYMQKVYYINNTINIKNSSFWNVKGNGMSGLKQTTNNIPILRFYNETQSTLGDGGTDIELNNILFDYVNFQNGLTNSNCIFFDDSFTLSESNLLNLTFLGGYYGIKVEDNTCSFWGCTLDNLQFLNGLTGGAIYMSAVNAIPNNHFGRLFLKTMNMKDIPLKLRGYNFIIDNIEVLAHRTDKPILFLYNDSKATIGAFKLEVGNVSNSGALIEIQGGCKFDIRELHFSGVFNNVTILKASAVGPTKDVKVNIEFIQVIDTGDNENRKNNYIFNVGGLIKLGSFMIDDKKLFKFFNPSSQNSQTNFNCVQIQNNQYALLTDDVNLDISETVSPAANYLVNSALTKDIVFNLPTDQNYLFDGLTYRIIIKPEVLGSYKISVKAGNNLLTDITNNNCVYDFTFKKNKMGENGTTGWFISNKCLLD